MLKARPQTNSQNKTLWLYGVGISVVALLGATTVLAVDQTLSVSMKFRVALALVKNFDINFTPGTTAIDMTGIPTAASQIQMGTNGAITYVGTAFSGPATGQVGDVTITGTTATPVNISCSTGATISNGTATIPVTGMRISMNTGTAFAAPGYTCLGVGTTPFSYTLLATNKILVGGQVAGAGVAIVAGTYTTALAGGVPATVRVVYQ